MGDRSALKGVGILHVNWYIQVFKGVDYCGNVTFCIYEYSMCFRHYITGVPVARKTAKMSFTLYTKTTKACDLLNDNLVEYKSNYAPTRS